jgi:hypothetical protein
MPHFIQEIINIAAEAFARFALVTVVSAVHDIFPHFFGYGNPTIGPSLTLDKLFHGYGFQSFGEFWCLQVEKVSESSVHVFVIGLQEIERLWSDFHSVSTVREEPIDDRSYM